jgi:hypothetical protein
LTAEVTTSKGTGSISCEVEFCNFTDSVSELYGQRMHVPSFALLRERARVLRYALICYLVI